MQPKLLTLVIALLIVGYFGYGYVTVHIAGRQALKNIHIESSGLVKGIDCTKADATQLRLPLHKIATLNVEIFFTCLAICLVIFAYLVTYSHVPWVSTAAIFSGLFFLYVAYRVGRTHHELPDVLFDREGLHMGHQNVIRWSDIREVKYLVSHSFDNDKTRLQSRLTVTLANKPLRPIKLSLNDYFSIRELLFPVHKFDHRIFVPLATLCQANGVKFSLTDTGKCQDDST